jgi:hypothetical protein
LVRDPRIQFADLWKYSTYKSETLVARRSVAAPDMLLGADFLRSHRVLIAHSQRKIYFTYAGGAVFPERSLTSCADIERRKDSQSESPVAK